ncbi:polycystin-1-like protein 2 isoform X1 [Saccostrea echinata]|uniref:polycystin-1-like protein 2 isoform X1 n=1 Tax=Saccostrea echinata TaxID=191078 RepID=UPI002A80F256|nr:polycystin-1-like protein 2 isoform X1 [Saccostrea echinata]
MNSTLEDVVANFSVIIVTTGCRSWDVRAKSWVSNGCTVLPMSTINETICRCPNPSTGSIFASTFYVPPNMIDFNTVWGKFDPSNAAVYGTVIALLVIYVISAIFLRREDKKDIERWAIHFLVDSDSTDEYFYMITVHTGLRRGAGTKSVVNFVLAGDEDDSGVRILSDGVKEGFDTGSVKKFIMGTKEKLGGLTYIRIWHDNSGSGDYQNWYLNKIVVDDPQTNTRYVFLCDRWLALDQDDGQVDRVVPVCGRDNLVAFNTLFAQHAQFNLTENHLWLSLMIRPERSPFTRVQRLSCVLALLFLTMIANAMFFKSSSEEQNSNEVQIGFLRFSMSTVYVSIIGIVLTTPPIMFVTMVFKKCKPKVEIKHKNKKKAQELDIKVKQNMDKELRKRAFNGEDFFTKDHLPLPHWMAYVAWVVVWLAVITSAFFLILYSMEWGKAKAEEWLSSFFLSFFESLICVDPLKVIIIAVLLAMLFKQPADGETPKMDLNKLKATASQYNSGSERSYMAFVNGIFNKSEPPPQSDLEKLRQKRKQELKAQEALMNLIFYAIFMFVIYSISYVERDHRAFFMKSNVDNYLVGHGNGQLGFSGINKTADLFSWLSQTFIPTFYPENYYSGASLGVQDKKYFGDLANIRVGPGRLRQVRMSKGECDYHKLTWPRYCVGYYNMYQEDESEYCLGWNPFNATACDTTEYKARFQTSAAWRFTESIDIWGLPLTGEYNTYGGGGYILKLPSSRLQAQQLLKELQEYNWIDRGTRAILVEFTLYNPNANLFTYVTYITEITEMGGSFIWTETNPFRPIVSLNAMGTFAIICYCVYVLYQLILTFNTLKGIRRDGLCKYYKVVWNVVDTVCLVLGYSAITIFILRLSYTNQAMDVFYDDKLTGENNFINFFHIVVWDMLFNILMSILVFIATLRILRILGYNQKLTEIITVVTNAAKEIIGFGVVFGMVFGGYVIFGYLIFGRSLYEYRSIFTSWGTLTNALIGKNSLDTMINAAPQLAQFYYFTYVFCVLFTLITMFAAILNKSITEVRNDSAAQGDMFGIIDMLTKSLKDIIGIAYKTDRSLSKNADAKKKYMQSIGMNAKFDAPNILRLVRTTLGEVNNGEGKLLTQQHMENSSSENLLLNKLDPYSQSRSFSRASGAETPGDISLAFYDTKR